jgi:hypothetical protein
VLAANRSLKNPVLNFVSGANRAGIGFNGVRHRAAVIASAAKQSIFPLVAMDCFVASLLAMTIKLTSPRKALNALYRTERLA